MFANAAKVLNKSLWLGTALLALGHGSVWAQQNGCDAEHTLISHIQGSGKSSPLDGQRVRVKAIVSAVMPDVGGYYLLEEQADWDDNAATSEGLFIADKRFKPKVGDKVSLRGEVSEMTELTHLEGIDEFVICGGGFQVDFEPLTLPLKGSLEYLESMPVHLTQTLSISDTYNLTRFGQMIVSNGRLYQPTNWYRPGKDAQQLAKSNGMNQLVIDDGSTKQGSHLVNQAHHPYRTGNTVSDVKGLLHFDFGKFVVQPLEPVKVIQTNPRESAPRLDKVGNVRVASFNVLNYFNGDGQGGGFPTKRGASDAKEFKRQADKIVAAMKVIDADVIGLMEVENDGFGKLSAIADLTARLNKASGGQYDYIRLQDGALGDALISVGMLYKPAKVTPLGKAATLNKAPFGVKSRPPIAQTFTANKGGDEFTVVVNHFKSKGSCPKDKADKNANQNDGQACWNAVRVESANLLLDWLATEPTGSKDKDILIIGDLNANAQEDPVIAIENRGFSNLIAKFNGKTAYSFVFRAEAGYLDHALASNSLLAKVVDTKDWHINADELRGTDYNLERKSEAQQQQLYRADAFRSSDHDPVIVELLLK